MDTAIFTPSRCHINLAALQRNFRSLGDPATLMPVIKGNAYGHGLLPVARALDQCHAANFAVGTVEEGLFLRDEGFSQRIVPLMSLIYAEQWQAAAAKNITPLLTSEQDLARAAAAGTPDKPLSVVLKCDTGMGRLGFDHEAVPALLEALRSLPQIRPVMVLSHLSCADMPDEMSYTQAQARRFTDIYSTLRAAFPQLIPSLGNSAGLLVKENSFSGISRPGIALYGGNPFAGTAWESRGQALEWVMSLSTPVVQIRRLKAGESLSYGRIFSAPWDMTVAVLGAGYASGLARHLSNRMEVLLHGRRVPQVGRICMNMCMIDVSSCPDVQVGDQVWLLGGAAREGDQPVSVQELADFLGTTAYEMLCLIGSTNPRVYDEK